MSEPPRRDDIEAAAAAFINAGGADSASRTPDLFSGTTGTGRFSGGIGGFGSNNAGGGISGAGGGAPSANGAVHANGIAIGSDQNLHTSFRYGGSTHGLPPTSPHLPALQQQHWSQQQQQQQGSLPPHSPGSLASLVPPSSPLRSNGPGTGSFQALGQSLGLPPTPGSSRHGQSASQGQHLSLEAAQRQLLQQQAPGQGQGFAGWQQQPGVGAGTGGGRGLMARRTASFDGGAGMSHGGAARSGIRPGFIHGRGGAEQQQHGARAFGPRYVLTV